MTEKGEIYNYNGRPATASKESRDLAEKFATAIGELNWRTDYLGLGKGDICFDSKILVAQKLECHC
jgi:hypothetical protein